MMISNYLKLASIVMLSTVLFTTACSDDNNPVNPNIPGEEIPDMYTNLPGTLITENETWSSDTTLAGPHFILPGVTLTIDPGVTVSFEYHNGRSEDVGTIIALDADDENFDSPRSSGRLVADGEADNPIVFTSARTNPERNDWGGIILVGHAPNNIPGGVGEVEGLSNAINYGGDKPDDDSGILRYVRIEYTGYSIAEGSELQALTLYSVGSGTTLEHINIYECSDDGVEWFGGNADMRYLVVYGADDDSFDMDQGWSGRGQFWLAVQREGADNGFENDGRAELGSGNPTSPLLSNITVYGAPNNTDDFKSGMRLREDFTGDYRNIILSNMPGYNFVLEGAAGDENEADQSWDNYDSGDLALSNFYIWNNALGWEKAADADRYAASYTETDPIFTDPDNFVFTLQTGSPALTGATVPSDSFFEQVEFAGAMGEQDWTREGSWVRWPNQ
ncbi:hypothetical protein [Fodinibius sediminis]|uniref:Uncharacterized protein n=1 Tax=Fodinibius sediminis TaxID=1214077 RepID=A0A521B904_9BACT|nr:hypothetical protein [Fodinibius sediminis]SMO43576.1 hypothetical protein SAMN06265218_102312 [Fodinibius sediminis]